ncbi:hypothetical protein BN1356_00921 [Streptococcus varani]|uniref:Phage protein n=1 Tax=Streptococcus varani TaxID=1608583 RepID=A0A0E4H7K9_9STRE|nr:hypothetical protein [Streptococcus varani]CQR24577.1 hypothetical protein BN1356_00921 [Streptococcus varani]
MSILEIKVRNEQGQKVAYENSYLPVLKYREYLEMAARHEDSDLGITEAEKLDEQLTFIASLFDGLTVDAMYSGIEMAELNDIISKVFIKLIGGDNDPKGKD